MQGYDGTQKFYSPYANQDLQLIEYGRLPNNQISKTSATGTTYIDKDNNQIVEILGNDNAGKTVFKRYQLIDLKALLKLPELQNIEGFDGNDVHLDRLTQELIGPSMFHSNDYNVETIEKAINLLLKNQALQQSNENEIIDFFKQLTDDQLSEISVSISKLIDERYYSKADVDKKIDFLQKQITNINHYIGDKPQPNSNFAKGFTGNPDYNDKIMDSNVEGKVENLNIEDEEGDSDGK